YRAPQALPLDRHPAPGEVEQVGNPDGRHPEAAPGLSDHKSVGTEPGQCFANCTQADAPGLGHRSDIQLCAGLKAVSEYVITQREIHTFSKAFTDFRQLQTPCSVPFPAGFDKSTAVLTAVFGLD